MVDIWAPRRQAEELLNGSLSVERDLMLELFSFMEELVKRLQAHDSEVSRVVSLVLLKAERLGLGTYGLTLDCLGQEGGAMFRLLQEAWELLIYFRLDPSRVRQVFDGTLPRAGQRARLIEGRFKKLREHLNKHASHLAFSFEAVGHMLDLSKGELRVGRRPSECVLRRNMATLFSVLFVSTGEAFRIAQDVGVSGTGDLARKFDDLKHRSFDRFEAHGLTSS